MSLQLSTPSDIVPVEAPISNANDSPVADAGDGRKGVKKAKKQTSRSNVVVADNFPSKTHLLITHLTEADPKVSAFSADGASFHVYDQATFSQKYLPQYFKHSNWGSFVRQLNLYGFTSSRLKENSDVVVWTHELFHRDKKELLIEIKRAKKAKSAQPKPSPVTSIPRVASPSSSEGGSSNHSDGGADLRSKSFSRKVSGEDHEWLQSQFTYLRKQNIYLEQKLDTLLKLTLRLSPVTLEEVQAGGKRRRVSRQELKSPGVAVVDISDDHLKPIHEEEKFFDESDFGSERVPFSGDRTISYDAAEEKPSNERFQVKDDSFKTFIDIMLAEDSDECKEMEGCDSENSFNDNPPTAVPSNPESYVNTCANNSSMDSSEVLDDDDFMAEVVNAILPAEATNSHEQILGLSLVGDESTNGMIRQPQLTQLATTVNLYADKSSGPKPIHVISPDTAIVSHDIEEGNMPVGVAVVSAHAVESNDENADALQHQLEQVRSDRRHKRKVIYFLAFISIAIVAAFIAWPSLVHSRRNDDEDEPMTGDPPPENKPPPDKRPKYPPPNKWPNNSSPNMSPSGPPPNNPFIDPNDNVEGNVEIVGNFQEDSDPPDFNENDSKGQVGTRFGNDESSHLADEIYPANENTTGVVPDHEDPNNEHTISTNPNDENLSDQNPSDVNPDNEDPDDDRFYKGEVASPADDKAPGRFSRPRVEPGKRERAKDSFSLFDHGRPAFNSFFISVKGEKFTCSYDHVML